MHHSNALAAASLAGILMALAGCGGKTKYPDYYVLNVPPAPAPSGTQSKPLLGSVAVQNFASPSFLRAGPIVYSDSPERINFYQYHRWALDPRTAVTNALLQNLQACGLFQSVMQFDGRENSDYLLTGRLDELKEIDNGRNVKVEVRMSAQLTNLKTGEVVWRDSSSESAGVEQRNISGVVAQMSQTTETSVEHLVSSMQKRLELMSASVQHTQPAQP
jgi:ABC-type uncharacterized transport system auxiliary subunit